MSDDDHLFVIENIHIDTVENSNQTPIITLTLETR